ncbi:hypothetical protein ANO14919_141840 [Xylariales sp. No.14919]|nr:hypothetical protein ANO14919_141840 [Xylariales sp. No.14919]
MAPEEFLEKADQEIDINTRGPMHLALHFLSHLRAKPPAVIINVSSVLGFAPFALINPMAPLEATNVRVVEIVPLTVATDLHREREDPDGNKKSSNPSTLSIDEFIAEISKPLENGDETIGAGIGVSLIHQRDTFMGGVFGKSRK